MISASEDIRSVPTGVGGESHWLRQQVRDREATDRLNRRLTGHGLPDVELRTLRAIRVPLHAHVRGWVAVELFPGEGTRAPTELDQDEMIVMRPRVEHSNSFQELADADARMLSVISDPSASIDFTTAWIDPHGLVLCDPELSIAHTLMLPMAENGGVWRYRRLTLLAKDARIEKVIFPPKENLAHHLRQIVTFIRAAGW
jgi:hypothetical protein